ncbi:MAG: hypothetical protein RIF32_18085 [Leptospirales bacterium]|jgi:hypothetical protein
MKLVRLNEFHSSIGDITNCFYAFFFLEQTLYSVHRRHRLFSLPHWPKNASENLSQVVLTRYIARDPLRIESEEVLCDGNDPRVVSSGSEAVVLSEGTVHSGIEFYLTRLPARKRIVVTRAAGVPRGKNWQPYLKNGQLYVVDSIAPFRTNRLHPETGVIAPEQEYPIDLDLPAAHDNYSVLRGGSNAIVHGDAVYGWGHATQKEYSHVPYVWKLSDTGPTISFSNLHAFFRSKGYHIVDPVSFIEWDDEHFALSVSCSQRDWFHSQWYLNALLIFKKQEYFSGAPFELNGDKIRSAKIFHAQDLASRIASVPVHGGVCNNGKRGWMLYGPGEPIDLSKRWTVELCYSSPARVAKCVGKFDVSLNMDGGERVVASARIYGTANRSTRARLEFDMSQESSSGLIQTRVFTRGWSSVTAYFFELIHGE